MFKMPVMSLLVQFVMLDIRFQQSNGIQLVLLQSVYTAQRKGSCISARERSHQGTQSERSWQGPTTMGDSSTAVLAYRPQHYKKLFTC